ncbi:hypothetical protein EKG38_05790 [Shewanella canadensis]|uniref:DUF998 domain-containing protein n=1 Tax=Shewanella canadensis TaxID=271096 RepID=A0A431WXK3_9GAMM|nr:hypothetical protein [Shewanella canadensis]RTR40226.1 hypothetical protein EKG38_05790 [Shewanella canadensis]
MQTELNVHSTDYDLHRLVIWMILSGALVTSVGISISVWAEYQRIGIEVFFRRADLLGDYIHSPLAYVYNMALISAGSCILLAMYGLYQLKLGDFSHYLSLSGFWVGLSIILIGVFPINYLDEHRLASTSFLIGTFVLHLLTIATRINHKEICSNSLFVLAIFGFISASGLIYQLDWSQLDFKPCPHDKLEICWVALNMWFQTNVTMLWCILLALNVRKLAINNTQVQTSK